MPMLAVREQNDARSAAYLLATTTLRELDMSEPVEETVMINMFRLIDDFRAHGFYGVEDQPAADDDFGPTSMLPSGERNIADVRAALERTVSACSNEGSADALMDDVERVLRAAAYPDVEQSGPELIERAKRFFGSFINNLQHAGV